MASRHLTAHTYSVWCWESAMDSSVLRSYAIASATRVLLRILCLSLSAIPAILVRSPLCPAIRPVYPHLTICKAAYRDSFSSCRRPGARSRARTGRARRRQPRPCPKKQRAKCSSQYWQDGHAPAIMDLRKYNKLYFECVGLYRRGSNALISDSLKFW